MNYWKNEGAYAIIAILMSPGEIWMEAVIHGCLKITKVLPTDCRTILAMNVQVMSALTFVSSFVQIVRKVIVRTVCPSRFADIALLNFANHAEC